LSPTSSPSSDEPAGFDGGLWIIGVPILLALVGVVVVAIVSLASVLGLPIRLVRRLRQWVTGHPFVPGAVAVAGAAVWVAALVVTASGVGGDAILIATIGCVLGCFLLALGLVHLWIPRRPTRDSSQAVLVAGRGYSDFRLEGQDAGTTATIDGLTTGMFLAEKRNVVVVADTIAGAELASALGFSAAKAGYRVEAAPVAEWLERLALARTRRQLEQERARTARNDLVVIGDVGTTGIEQDAVANLLWRLIARIGNSTSIIVSTSVPPERWVEVFGSSPAAEVLVTSLLDGACIVRLAGAGTAEGTGNARETWVSPGG
jgi:hypothetical protein